MKQFSFVYDYRALYINADAELYGVTKDEESFLKEQVKKECYENDVDAEIESAYPIDYIIEELTGKKIEYKNEEWDVINVVHNNFMVGDSPARVIMQNCDKNKKMVECCVIKYSEDTPKICSIYETVQEELDNRLREYRKNRKS